MDSIFKPLSAEEKRNTQIQSKKKDKGIAIVPVPDDAPLEMIEHYQLGKPDSYWGYKNQQGQALFFVCRFIDKDGKKHNRPLTYREYQNGHKKWWWAGLDAPRPLYGLDRLAQSPHAAVIICEGEKATDAATELFEDHIAVTSPNGSGSPHKADWSPLEGREIIIWPDNDDEGKRYAQSVARLVKKSKALSVSVVSVPNSFPEKWDLADEFPEGYSEDELLTLLKDAEPVLDPLENLIERVQESPGEAYKDDVIDALADLKRENLPEFINIRYQLKKAGAGVTMLDESIQNYSYGTGESGSSEDQPDHLELSRIVLQDSAPDNYLGTTAHVWLWRKQGVWRPIVDRELKQIVLRVLEREVEDVSKSLVDGVTDVLKTEIFAPEHKWDINLDAVNMLNGELHLMDGEWVLQPHCREHYRTTQIPIEYDPQAQCPRFEKFLLEIFAGDLDAQDKAAALLEMIGYTLVSHARFEKFALLVGSGANGKSVVLEVIRALVGRENVAAVQPTQFDNKFQRAHLHLKLANLVTEIPEGGQIADAELKAITSGELTTAEHKNKDPFDFCPFATCWFGTNHMPHTRDFSDALFRRALVIPFNNTFKAGVNADPGLKDELLTQLPGILNLALKAFSQVIKAGSFTEPESCLKAKQEWRKEVDQVAQFVEEKCVLEPENTITSSALYDAYKEWAAEAGVSRTLNRKNFSSRLLRLGCSKHKGSQGKRMIKGIRIGWKAT